MQVQRQLPDTNRLSVVAATILLAYSLTPFIQFPDRSVGIQLPGFFLPLNLTFTTVVSILVAILAASGTDWLLLQRTGAASRSRISHWMLPALTAWVIGVPLTNLELSIQWWGVFFFGGVLLILVLVSEYIVFDPSDVRHAPASIGLTVVSFGLFLILSIAVRAAGVRLYTLLLAITPFMFFVSLRALNLRLGRGWQWAWALAIALAVSQLAIGLHYLPLPPLSYSLLLLGMGYGLTSLAGAWIEGRSVQTLWIEPLLMTALIWLLAWILGGLFG